MDKESFRFWIVPMIALFVGFVILGYTIEYKINTITPNAIVEFVEIKEMSCEEIKDRNALGSYWTPDNGKFARDMVQQCIDAEKAYKAKLRDIRNTGTHQQKLDAGFEKLWFGEYDHIDLPFKKAISVVPIPLGTVSNEKLYPEITVISDGYNFSLVNVPNGIGITDIAFLNGKSG